MLSSFGSQGLLVHSSAFSALSAPHLKQLVVLAKIFKLQTQIHPFLPTLFDLVSLGAIIHSAAFSDLLALLL